MSNKKYTFKQKARYFFDNTLSKGTSSIIIWLAVLTLLLILIFGTVYLVTKISPDSEEGMGTFEAFWQTFTRSLDPGTMATDTGWGRLIGVLVTIGGIFILSALIGVLTTSLDEKLQMLRKGRSLVIEENHTLILGWSPKIMQIISELVIANENQKKPRIVILADEDKVMMDDEIRANVPNTKNTKVVCRTGDPLNLVDLLIVNPNGARSVIILSPDKKNPDTYVIKTMLALTLNPKRKAEKFNIVAEIKEEVNLEVAQIVGKDEAMFVLSPDLTARITAQTCRQSGLSIIYMQLLCYEGDELYFKQESTLNGKTFKDAVFAYNNSAVLGFLDKDNEIHINPPFDTILTKDDKILAISEDDDTVIMSGMTDFKIKQNEIIQSMPKSSVSKEKNLILGWNERGKMIIRELDEYVAPGSEIHILSDINKTDKIQAQIEKFTKNQSVTFMTGDITSAKVLNDIGILNYNNIIILSYYDIEIQEADAKTLICLLHIRNIADKEKAKVNIVSEMFDQRNRELAEVTKADDFIISEDLISRYITQLSETPDLKKVFDDLFRSEGSEIYLKDIEDYVKTGVSVNFYTLIESASLKHETALGYRIIKKAHNVEENYGICMNPDKSKEIVFSPGDKIIVLAED